MQTSTTTGHADATPLLGENLRRLGALRPDAPVLSLFLDLNPTDFGTQRARRSAYTSLLDEAHKRVEEYADGHDAKVSLRGDLERAQGFLHDYQPKRGRGLAIFAASAAGLFKAYTLPRAPQTHVAIGESPYVAPLFEAADPRDWLIVLVDARHARFLHGNPDHVEAFDDVEDHIAGQHEGQGPTDHQRWVEREIDVHLKKAAEELDRQLGTGRFERILVGGPPEIAPRFVDRHMSSPARAKLAGRFDVEVPDTIADEIRAAATACFDEDERRHERAVLERLAERLGRGERAVAGIADVCAMLEQARVETLLYDDGFDAPDPGVLETVVEEAVAQAAEVLPLRRHRGALEAHGHIAAVLRF